MGIALAAATPAYAQESLPATPAPQPAVEISGEDLTAFVRARAADALGAADTAAKGYSVALADVPGDAVIAVRAYRQGLAAGDYALARRATKTLVETGVAPPDAAILDFAVALDRNDRPGADAALDRMRRGPLDFMAPVLRAWMAFDAKGDPLALLNPAAGNSLSRRYAAWHRALILIALKRTSEGLEAVRPLLRAPGADGDDLRIDAALLLTGTGKRNEARALFAGRSAGKGVKGSAKFGAARLFLSLAAELSQEDAGPLSILLARSALLLDPADDRARLYLAEALSKSGAVRLALDVLGEVKRSSPFARGAAAGRIAVLRRAGRTDEAIVHARTLAEDRDATVADIRAYGDILAETGQFAAAAIEYRAAIGKMGGDGGWELNYLLGTALDRADRWDEALPALRRAVTLGPEEVSALTYLGFAQVEHRGDLTEAQALLERAKALKPGDAAIADALAWAYHLRGETAKALPLLEEAARADPGGSLVNEHLGDVYWALGRKFEARYAWSAAKLYAAENVVPRIEAKLAGGATAAN